MPNIPRATAITVVTGSLAIVGFSPEKARALMDALGVTARERQAIPPTDFVAAMELIRELHEYEDA